MDFVEEYQRLSAATMVAGPNAGARVAAVTKKAL
jgi:hypothetical protein